MKVDEKGKYFTNRVSTRRVEVLVLTIKGQVQGQAHLAPGQRIKDMLNHEDQFLALTGVTLTTANGVSQQVDFMAVNKLHIISVIPLKETPQETTQDEYYPY